jgi:hypothetical protein
LRGIYVFWDGRVAQLDREGPQARTRLVDGTRRYCPSNTSSVCVREHFSQFSQAMESYLSQELEMTRCNIEPSRSTRRRERVLLHIGCQWPGASERGC